MLAVVLWSRKHVSFEEIADQRLLSSARTNLGELSWDTEADASLRMRVTSDIPFEGMMTLMTRRGLDPLLVRHLFDRLSDRPLERALVAWDIARGSVLGRNDGELVQRIANEIAPLKQLGPLASVAVPRDRVAALAEAARNSGVPQLVVDAPPPLPSLAGVALAENTPELVAAVTAHAKQLAYAHLPSLALAFLQILCARFDVPQAFDLMIEIAVEHDMLDAPPIMSGTDDRSVIQQTYVLLRTCSRQYDTINGKKYLEALDKHPAVHASTDPSLVLAKAELALLQNERVDSATKAIVDVHGQYKARRATEAWRYGVFVFEATEMRFGYGSPTQRATQFTWTFGNNARLWGHVAFRDELRAELLTELSRELRYASHDPEVWRAIALLVPNGESIDAELDLRLAQQLATTFA
jgi:hypothetical protein